MLMQKEKALKKIEREITKCIECKINTSGKPVPGEGDTDADIMFLGEAPGRTEAATGRPFVGRSGQFLTTLIESIGLKRTSVFITSPVKYYPGMRAPTPKEISHGRLHLTKQITVIKPKLIVLLGATALKALLPEYTVTKAHGKLIEENNMKYFITFHPAAALRFPPIRILIQTDFEILKKAIGEAGLDTLE